MSRDRVGPQPRWVIALEIGLPAAIAFAVAVQRDALLPPRWPLFVAAAAALPWWLRACGRRLPLVLTVLIVLGAVLALEQTQSNADVAPFFLVLLAATTAIDAPPWQGLAVMTMSMSLMIGLEVIGNYHNSFAWVLGIALGWSGGFALRKQLALLEQERAMRAGLAEQAVTEERQRIAREVHDVVAHSLAVTVLYLTGARRALRRDPEETEHAMLEAERLGRQSLAEIRRTVGLLVPAGLGTAPAMPTAAEIPRLVHEFDSAGLDVAFECIGPLDALSPATGLGLYRIVQESLANVVKHAPGAPTSISLRVGDDVIRLSIRNRLNPMALVPAPEAGVGLRGMRERAGLLGGAMWAGTDGDHWCVEVDVPRAPPPPT